MGSNQLLLAAGVLGAAYLLSQRGNAGAGAPALALPGSNLTAPTVTAPTGLLPPLTIRVEAPTISLPAVNVPAAAPNPAIGELTQTVRRLVDRVIERKELPVVGELVLELPGGGSLIEDLTGKIEDLTGSNAGLLDQLAEAAAAAKERAAEAAELVRLDAIKSALADWTAGAAARDAAEAAYERARELARVDTILDDFYDTKDQLGGGFELGELGGAIADPIGAVRSAAGRVEGQVRQAASDALDQVPIFGQVRRYRRFWNEGIQGYRYAVRPEAWRQAIRLPWQQGPGITDRTREILAGIAG